MRFIAIIAALLLPLSLPAQQGSGAKSLLAPALPAPQQKFLIWDSTATNFAVYTGLTRLTATNRSMVFTNRIPLVSNRVYAVAAIVGKLESTKSYWPSNAIYVPVLYHTVDMVNWKRGQEFPEVTNTPVKLLRMVNEFKRWE